MSVYDINVYNYDTILLTRIPFIDVNLCYNGFFNTKVSINPWKVSLKNFKNIENKNWHELEKGHLIVQIKGAENNIKSIINWINLIKSKVMSDKNKKQESL